MQYFSIKRLYIIVILYLMVGCKFESDKLSKTSGFHETPIIYIQPLGNFSDSLEKLLEIGLVNTFRTKVYLMPKMAIPQNAWFAPRHRYWADSILVLLHPLHLNANNFTLGVMEEDISTKKGIQPNWGVMGLGYQPGNCCLVSTYRLNMYPQTLKQLANKLVKIALHELGHNFGLPHCSNWQCIMTDAKEKDHLEKEKGFCLICTKTLTAKGLQLN